MDQHYLQQSVSQGRPWLYQHTPQPDPSPVIDNEDPEQKAERDRVLLFFYIELICKSLPALIFLGTAFLRYKEIKSIGFSKTTIFSRLYKAKMAIQISQFFLDGILITLYFVEPLIYKKGSRQASHYIYEDHWLSLIFITNMIAWLVGARLMDYEYRKRLSEAYYCHWLFWTLMLIDNLVFLILNFSYYEWYLILVNVLSLISNSALCVMMVITKKRTVSNPRPDNFLIINDEENISMRRKSTKPKDSDDSISQGGSAFLDVKMSKKFIQDKNVERAASENRRQSQELNLQGHKFEFTVSCIQLKSKKYKVQRTQQQFIELEQHIIELMNEYDNLKNDKSSRFSYQKMFLSRGNQQIGSRFKQLRQNLPSHQLSQPQYKMNHDSNKIFIMKIETLERLLRGIAGHQELWSEQVFDFFDIPGEYLTTLLDEKERYLTKPKSKIYENIRHQESFSKNSRTMSNRISKPLNVSDNRFDEIEEEEDRNNHQQQLNAARFQTQLDQTNFKMIDNYISTSGPMNPDIEFRGENHLQKSKVSANGLKLVDKRSSFAIKIPSWMKTSGNFVEYQILIDYREGSTQQWEIHRRFSDFQELSQLIQEYFKAEQAKDKKFIPPKVPQKLTVAQLTNQALDNRAMHLQVYLTQLLALPHIPKQVLEFIEFHKATNMNKALTLLDDINLMNKIVIKIPSTEILIDETNQKPKVHFNVEIKAKGCDQKSLYFLRKQYKDFDNFHKNLIVTFQNIDDELLKDIPPLPQKRQVLLTQDLQYQLESFINQIISNPGFCNLLITNNFFAEGLQSKNFDKLLSINNIGDDEEQTVGSQADTVTSPSLGQMIKAKQTLDKQQTSTFKFKQSSSDEEDQYEEVDIFQSTRLTEQEDPFARNKKR